MQGTLAVRYLERLDERSQEGWHSESPLHTYNRSSARSEKSMILAGSVSESELKASRK